MIRANRYASLGAALLGLLAVQVATPASAGSFSVSLTPKGETADLIRHGLQIYSAVEQQKSKKKNSAKVNQKGRNNAAAVRQKGGGNYGLVHQRGDGHTATLAQDGRNNAFGVFQFGRNTNADIAQTGNGNVGLLFVGGW